jgi:hypothetical protein
MLPIRIKISHPQLWFKYDHWDYKNLTQNGVGKWGSYQFFVNDLSCKECDFWVIHENTDITETITCPPENVIYIPGEEASIKPLYPQKYLNQFCSVFTSREDIKASFVSRGLYLCPWQIKKTYSELTEISLPFKKRELSAIISNNVMTEGHRRRFALINKLKGHFKSHLDWYAKGENFIENKWDGLIDYQYSIAIENSQNPNYMTEKLMDCFLAYTMPIYLGAPNIGDFYPDNSYVNLANYDYLTCIGIIEEAIASKFAEKNKAAIIEARNLVLNHYQFIPLLIDYIEKNQTQWSNVRIKNKIHPIGHFTNISLFKRAISYSIRKVKNI